MIPYGIPALVLFGACAPLAAFIADYWTRNAMITVFFVGIGAASVATGFAESPLQIGIGLSVIAIFAAIYHPVGMAMVIEGGGRVGWRIGVNGVWGNIMTFEEEKCKECDGTNFDENSHGEQSCKDCG